MGVSDPRFEERCVRRRRPARGILRLLHPSRKRPWRPIISFLLIGTLSLATTLSAAGLPPDAPPAGNGPAKANAKARQSPGPAPQAQSLGSLATAGDVFADGTRVPGQLTVFGGDDIRVGEGMATLTAADQRGSLAIFPQSEVVFSSNPRFEAELKAGRAGVRSSNMRNGVILRAGNFVIVGSVRGQESAETVDRMADGSFLIACDEGNIGVVPLGGGNGLFLRAGQSAQITAAGALASLPGEGQVQETTSTTGPTTPPPNLKKGSLTWLWILLGAGGGGATIAAIVVATRKARPPVTPDSP